MSNNTTIVWTDVYRTETPMHAKLIAGVLDARGLTTKIQRKKYKNDSPLVPFVLVESSQAHIARDILAASHLSLSEVA